jgi:hypothetical protein
LHWRETTGKYTNVLAEKPGATCDTSEEKGIILNELDVVGQWPDLDRDKY